MSAQLLADETALDTEPVADLHDQVDVNLDDLIVGRALTNAVYDDDGMLLLAEGSTITSEFRRLLKQRGMKSVRMHTDDASKARFNVETAASIADLGAFSLDSALTRQLERVIDSGLMFVQNTGPAVRGAMVAHGRSNYDAEQLSEYRNQREAACGSIDTLMKDALRGKAVDSTAVTTLAARQLSDLSDDADCLLATALEASRDADLASHSIKMATLGMAIGVEMGLDENNCKRICVAGLIHDWGMARVPAEIRNAPRILTDYDFFQIKKHPIYTAEMLERIPGLPSMVPVIVYQVHERPNGMGYPRGRSGDRIHLFARILAVADIYAALTESRPYRAALTPYSAMECLIKLAKFRDVDPEVVRAFLKVMNLFPIGSFIALSDGSVAQVIRRNGDKYTQPIVRVLQDGQGRAIPEGTDSAIVDLADSPLQVVQALPTPGRDEQLLTDEILQVVRNMP